MATKRIIDLPTTTDVAADDYLMLDGSTNATRKFSVSTITDAIADLESGAGLDAGAVDTAAIADDAVTNDKLADNSVSTATIQNGAVTLAKIASGSNATTSVNGLMSSTDKTKLDGFSSASDYALKSEIVGAYIYKGSVATESLLPSSGMVVGDVYNIVAASSYGAAGSNVAWNGSAWDALGETFELGDGAITEGKIANSAVTTAKIADDGVTTAKIFDLSVTGDKIADGAIDTDKLALGSVTNSILSNGSVTTEKVADEAITEAKLAEDVTDEFDALYNGIEMERHDIRTAEVEGGVAVTENAAKTVPVDFTVYGNSTQFTTTGLNLWDEEWEVGSIDNTTGENITGNFVRSKNYIPVEPSTQYYMTLTTGYRFAYDENKSYIGTFNLNTATTPANCHYVRFRMDSAYGTTYKNDICLNVSGSMNGTYEPYTGGKSSPNPDYPQDILSVDASVLTMVGGKNLLDPSLMKDQAAWNIIPVYAPVGTKLTMSTNCDAKSNTTGLLVFFRKPNAAQSSTNQVYVGHAIYNTVPDSGYVEIVQRRASGEDSFANYEWQIEFGNVHTTYEPFQGKVTAPIDLQGYDLRSLPNDTKDELHLTYDRPSNHKGWAWYKASIEQRLELLDLGGISWAKDNSGNTFYSSFSGRIGASDFNTRLMCSAFAWSSYHTPANMPDESFAMTNTATGPILRIKCATYYDQYTAAQFKTALSGLMMLYPLATPVTIHLDDIELPVIPTDHATVYVTGSSARPTWHMDYQIDADAELVQVQERVNVLEAQLFGNQLVGTMSGTFDTVADAYAAPPMALTVEGNSTQVTYSGKNLYEGTDETFVRYKLVFLSNNLLPDTYTISANVTSNDTDSDKCIVLFYYNYNNIWQYYYTYLTMGARSSATITFDYPIERIAFYASNSYDHSVDDTATWANIQIELGSTATSYEPYTGGKPSPNPDYPQEILSVDDLTLGVRGKNLLDLTNFVNKNAVTYTYENDILTVTATTESGWCYARYRVSAVEWMQGRSVTLSTIASATGTPDFAIEFHTDDGSRISYAISYSEVITRTVPSDTSYIDVLFYARNTNAGTVGDTATYRNIQLELGSTATAYEPYQGTTVSDLLPEGTDLRSLPDGTKDTLSLAYLRPSTRAGWAWYSRELVQKVWHVDDVSTLAVSSFNANYKYLTYTAPKTGVNTVNSQTRVNVLCSNYLGSRTLTKPCCYVTSSGIAILFGNDDFTDRATAESMLSGVSFDYQLATPVTTTLDPIELPELPAPNATVFCDGGSAQPTYQMQYVQDTNIVIADLRAVLDDLATS